MTGLTQPDILLRRMLQAAIASASPDVCVPPNLPEPPRGRTIIVGAGKASAAMARALELNWQGELSGVVITRYGHAVACDQIEVVEAGHPVPDDAGVAATQRLKACLAGLTKDDLVICLLSGGGSSLLVDPARGISLTDKQRLTHALLRSGATIAEMNCVRKHLSSIKGGRLAQMTAPAQTVTLAISDVAGDVPDQIASGPTVADPSTRQDAITVLAKYAITAAPGIVHWLEQADSETPKHLPDDRCTFRLIAAPAMALDAAAAIAWDAGWGVHILGDAIEGEARDVARCHAEIVRNMAQQQKPPCVLLSGGETTVTLRGNGRGGRNSEFLLALALALEGVPGIHALAADTDGIDGSEDNAGAIIWPGVLDVAAALGCSAAANLAANDSYAFFEAAGGLVFTGPTRTNVNDFRAIAIAGAGHEGEATP